ncbi:MAG: hypothetical protein ROW48_17020 [Bellilinea sp.]
MIELPLKRSPAPVCRLATVSPQTFPHGRVSGYNDAKWRPAETERAARANQEE